MYARSIGVNVNGISALRLGRREGRELLYVGKVGTGFTRKSTAEVRRQLEPLAVKRSPLTKPIRKPDTTWVEPKFQAEVTYGHITNDGLLRHPHSSGWCREAFPCAAPADLLVRWNIGHEIALSDEEDDEEATTT